MVLRRFFGQQVRMVRLVCGKNFPSFKKKRRKFLAPEKKERRKFSAPEKKLLTKNLTQRRKGIVSHSFCLGVSLSDTMCCFFHYDWQQTPKLLGAEQLQA